MTRQARSHATAEWIRAVPASDEDLLDRVLKLGWMLVEADDPAAIADKLLDRTDPIRYEFTPVIEDDQLGELPVQHGHG